jgi:hypothetical protein
VERKGTLNGTARENKWRLVERFRKATALGSDPGSSITLRVVECGNIEGSKFVCLTVVASARERRYNGTITSAPVRGEERNGKRNS